MNGRYMFIVAASMTLMLIGVTALTTSNSAGAQQFGILPVQVQNIPILSHLITPQSIVTIPTIFNNPMNMPSQCIYFNNLPGIVICGVPCGDLGSCGLGPLGPLNLPSQLGKSILAAQN